jgi:hypothetical protein
MSGDSFIHTAWADDPSTDLSGKNPHASWGRVSVGVATLALVMSVGGTIVLPVLAADPGRLPDFLIPLSFSSIALSVQLAAVGVVFAVVGLLRREGTRALAGLGLGVVAVLPLVMGATLVIAAISGFD